MILLGFVVICIIALTSIIVFKPELFGLQKNNSDTSDNNVCAACVNGTLNKDDCVCTCDEGYTGINCQTPIPPPGCPTIDCVEGQGYIDDNCECTCFGGYTGESCGSRLCESKDCGSGTMDINCECDCGDVTCHNGGYTNPDDCSCICPPDYSGINCEIKAPLVCTGLCIGGEHDDNCACVCKPNYYGDDCSCVGKTCANGGTFNTETCKCDCTYGYGGESCNIENVSEICSSTNCTNGQLRSNPCRCECGTNYGGDDCSCLIKNCNNGTQNMNTCNCECNPGWKGEFCNVRDCPITNCNNGFQDPNNCQCNCSGVSCVPGKGALTQNCQCQCYAGYQGADCSQRDCPPLYCGPGTMNPETCQCQCPAGYDGPNCQYSNPDIVCQNTPCGNGTRRDSPCRCDCNYGWSGAKCDIPDPNKLCTGLQCINGTKKYPCECECDPTYTGFGCATKDCTKAGPNGGPVSCQFGTLDSNCACQCWPSYSGADCSTRDCSAIPCQNGTHDSLCNCQCDPGWSGVSCTTNNCQNTVCYNGDVDGNCQCQCDPGYTGNTCRILGSNGNSIDYNSCLSHPDGLWSGYQCVSKTGGCPMPNQQICTNWGGFWYVHDSTDNDPWQCALGDERNGGTIGDSRDYYLGGRCFTGQGEAQCQQAISDLGCGVGRTVYLPDDQYHPSQINEYPSDESDPYNPEPINQDSSEREPWSGCINRCLEGDYENDDCDCDCKSNWKGFNCAIRKSINSKSECDDRSGAVWTGYECISTTGSCPFDSNNNSNDYKCVEYDDYWFAQDKATDDPYECILGSEKDPNDKDIRVGYVGMIGDISRGDSCFGSNSKSDCEEALDRLGCD